MRLNEAPVFSRARVTALGSLDTSTQAAAMLGATVTPWTHLRESDDAFAEVDIRGVLDTTGQLQWLSGDAVVEFVERPRWAGLPEDVVPQAQPTRTPTGDDGDEWPLLIWESQTLFSAVVGWADPEISVEIILCALAVAPSDGDVRPMLVAALKARYARVVRQPHVYPPARYPWRRQSMADIDAILSL